MGCWTGVVVVSWLGVSVLGLGLSVFKPITLKVSSALKVCYGGY